MSEPDWGRTKAIFGEALDLLRGERASFLDAACAGDTALRARVEGLLAADQVAGEFMCAPSVAGPEPAASATVPAGAAAVDVGDRIGPYTLLSVIGEGGFGVVYAAEQSEPLRRRVALKVIKLGMDTRQVIARFDQERQALALMDHPNIARVFDAGATAQGRPYFVMELIKGVPITQYCDTARLTPRQRLGLFIPVCEAVQHAHQKGIIHRDLKPNNVLVMLQDGRPVPKIIDFGIVKATWQHLAEKAVFTEQRQFIGTPEYMSPEQADLTGLDIDTRSDVYSLGVLLYELLTGATPFDAKELRSAALAEMQRIIREVDPPKPSTRLSTVNSLAGVAASRRTELGRLRKLVRGDLDWIVMKCLEKDRVRRYATANGLVMDVERYLAGEPLEAAPPGRVYRLRKFVRRHRGPVLGGLLIGAALVLGMAGTSVGLVRADRARRAEALQRQVAERTVGFMEDLLGSVEPWVALGRDTTVLRELMDGAAEKIEAGELRGSPEAEIGLRRTIGQTYTAIAQLDKSDRMLTRGLELARRSLPADHTLTAGCMNDLGELRLWQDRVAEAASLCGDALAMRRRLFQGDSPDVADSLNDVAYCLQAKGKAEEALPQYEAALAMRQRIYTGDHRDVSEGLSNLGFCLASLGHYDEALSRHAAALQMRQRLFKGDHPDVALSLNNVASTLMLLGRASDALPKFEAALGMYRRLLQSDHPTLARALSNVARCLQLLGRPIDALPKYQEALEIYRRVRSGDHPDVASAMYNVGFCLQSLGRPSDALPFLRDALAMRERLVSDGRSPAWQRFNTMSSLGEVVAAMGRFAEAEPLLVKGFEALNGDPGVPSPAAAGADFKRDALNRMVGLYQAWDAAEPGKGFDAKAAEWKARLDAFPPAPPAAPK